MPQFSYKMQQLLQIATTLLQNMTVITKCRVYYKLRQYKLLPAKGLYYKTLAIWSITESIIQPEPFPR